MTANSTLSESSVLTPLDPSKDINSDEWPDFELNNARVHLPKDRSTTTSLLVASEHYNLAVVGDVQLHSIPKDVAHTIQQQNHGRTASIEISDVRLFAYGQFEDGTVALWAGGRAGWFRIKPARAYRETYNLMIEAIKMLYFVADAYREERTARKGKKTTVLPPYSARELFEKHAQEVVGVSTAVDEAAEKIYQHVDFLFASMLAGKEGIDWMQNPLFLHLQAKCHLEHATVAERLAGPLQKAALRAALKAPQASIESGSTTSSLKRKRGRPPLSRDHEVISVASSSTAGSTVRAAQKPTLSQAPKMTSAPLTKAATYRRTRRKPSPTTETVPEELEEAELAETPILEISDSEEEHATRAGKGKSALRLKPSRGAKGKKGQGSRSGKAPVVENNDRSEDEPTSSPTAAKRTLPNPPANSRPSKRRNSKPEVDEGIDMPESPLDSEPLDDDPGTPDAVLGASATESEEPLTTADAARLNHAPDPVQEDTWRCALDGCTHKVYLASQQVSQRLIREHYALHAYDDDERVSLVRKLEAPSLPVDRLMEKVRLQARVEGFPGSRVTGSRFPEAVRQRC
ncbi:hypothetical protein B0A55_04280 [Friedmanniomyces simplex]|uniref:DNA (cytosine-5)-methyltransferase 1 replication foci domain-containing protein n=1 Tax=Friedmanniomyces simplex TaxID=329884 RepID=A0A4U0XC04_9PEZI|nr:hypothetical protein B0A55_04280 [Friedmanniomyces simplex]